MLNILKQFGGLKPPKPPPPHAYVHVFSHSMRCVLLNVRLYCAIMNDSLTFNEMFIIDKLLSRAVELKLLCH